MGALSTEASGTAFVTIYSKLPLNGGICLQDRADGGRSHRAIAQIND